MSDSTSTEINPHSERPEKENRILIALIRGLFGGLFGAAIGFFLFRWMASHGYYSVMLPGALLGIGFGWAAKYRSAGFGILCGVTALLLGFWSEWMVRPWIKDESLQYFLSNIGQLSPVTFLMIGLGTAMAYWFGRGR